MVKNVINALCLFSVLFAFGSIAQSQTPKWVTGYYPYWWYDAVTPEQVDMGAITHLVLFNASPNPNTSPYLTGTSAVEGGTNLSRILNLAHARGVKVILSVGGIYGGEAADMRTIANDAAKSAVFAKAASDYALSKGIDGLEMDWEFPQAADRTGWNRLNRLIRNELDKWPVRGIYICAAYARTGGATDSYFAYVRDSMLVYFDQINAMTYTMWQGSDQDYRSGFDTPVNAPTQFSGYNGYSLSNEGPLSFVNAGYPASKIGVSISFEGTRFSGVTTMGQKYSAWAFCSSATRSAGSGYANIPTSGRQYDATAQAAWCASGGSVYSFQDTNSVKAISNWAKSNGFGGVMIYDFPAGHDLANSVPDILLKTVAATIRGNSVPPPTGTLSATPNSLPLGGGTVTLTWTSNNALTASIDQGIGSVALSGSQANVSVTSTKTFRLTLTNSGGPQTYTATVTVAAPPAPTGTFTVTPTSLPAGGDSVTLAWTSSNATTGTINQGVGSVSIPGGSKRVRVSATTTFQLSLSNGTVTQTYNATVTVAVSAPTGTFSVTPDTLPAGGGSVRLTWTSSNATSATINQGIGTVALSGTRVNSVTSTRTFILTLTNTAGVQRTYNAPVFVRAANPGAPTGTFSVTPATLPAAGGNVTMTWTSSGATSASIDQGIGTVPTSGTRVNVFVDSTTDFQLTLLNASGTQSYIATVTVAPIGSLSATPPFLPVGGGSVTLSWTSANATTATIDQGIGDVPLLDSQTLSIVTKTTFQLTLSNAAGTRTYTVTVDVDGSTQAPKDFALEQNFPNPFNPSTRIIFKIPADADVRLIVFNVLGQTIATIVDRRLAAGSYAFPFSSGNLSSGMYYYVIKADNYTETRKMMILK